MIFSILFVAVQFCIAQIHPEQRMIPIVSDQHGILCFGNPYEQNENSQGQSPIDEALLMDELPPSADFHQEMDMELSPFHISQPQDINTMLTDEDIESLSPCQYQPVYTFMRSAQVNQNTASPEAHQQEIPSLLSQETAMIDMNIESANMELGTLLAYGNLGPISADEINIEALYTDTAPLLNGTYQFWNALMRDAQHEPNTSDPLAHLQIRATFPTNEKVQSLDERRDENIACPTSSGSSYGQSFGSIWSNSDRSVVQSDNFKHYFVHHTSQKTFHTSSAHTTDRRTCVEQKRFQIDASQKQLHASNGYKTHHRRTHINEKPSNIDIRQKQIRTSSVYQTYQPKQPCEKPFKCDFCRKEFSRLNNCQRHRLTHTGEKPFQCDVCPKQFRTSASYERHRRTHTDERPFTCDICPKRFRTSGDYQIHRRTHTGEKPYKCDFCEKEFSERSNCQRHRLTHTGEKPVLCEICPKQFSTFSDYQRHRRAHTGEKPFKCDFCQKEFSDRSNCQRHRRTHAVDELLTKPVVAHARNSSVRMATTKHIDEYTSVKHHARVNIMQDDSLTFVVGSEVHQEVDVGTFEVI